MGNGKGSQARPDEIPRASGARKQVDRDSYSDARSRGIREASIGTVEALKCDRRCFFV